MFCAQSDILIKAIKKENIMESIPLDRAENGNLISGKNGNGTITFWSATINQRYRNSNWAFYDIENCERVWDIFERAREARLMVRGNANLNREL